MSHNYRLFKLIIEALKAGIQGLSFAIHHGGVNILYEGAPSKSLYHQHWLRLEDVEPVSQEVNTRGYNTKLSVHNGHFHLSLQSCT